MVADPAKRTRATLTSNALVSQVPVPYSEIPVYYAHTGVYGICEILNPARAFPRGAKAFHKAAHGQQILGVLHDLIRSGVNRANPSQRVANIYTFIDVCKKNGR
jgi:hypothetical protein